MDGNEAVVSPDSTFNAGVDLLLMPVESIVQCLLGQHNDEGWINPDIRLTTALGPGPSPDIAEHPTMQVHQKTVSEDLSGTPGTSKSLHHWKGTGYVVSFGSVQISGSQRSQE